MTKNKISKLKNQSKEKWEAFLKDVKREPNFDFTFFQRVYWIKCGYCFVYFHCEDCPLNKKTIMNIPICDSGLETPSVASNALNYANGGHWEMAHIYGKIVLDEIKKDMEE